VWGPKSKHPAALKRGTEIRKVLGHETKRRVVQLHVEQGLSLRETAKRIGRHYKYVCLVWQGIVKEVSEGSSPEGKEQIRAFVDQHLRGLIEDGRRMFPEAAAYGAVAAKCLEQLADLHGLKAAEIAPEGMSLEQVGEQVRVVSPLLIDKIEKVRALSGISAARAEAREAAESGETVKE
jgi:transposase-like protein